MKYSPLLVILCLSLTSCSGSKSAQTVDQDTPQIELSDADEFMGNGEATEQQPIIGLSDLDSSMESSAPIEDTQPVVTEDFSMAPSESLEDMSPMGTVTDFSAGSEKEYVVQKNETLMLIAFKIYGDYERWKELANYNKIPSTTQLMPGTTLKYLAPAQKFVWNPEGNPYLIRTGDSLSKISGNVYNDIKKWKLIWNNNKPLIKDPNKIFAGFTIYYLESGREVASGI